MSNAQATDSQIAQPARSPLAEQYYRDGFYFPLDGLTAEEAAKHRQHLEKLERQIASGEGGNKSQLNYANVIFKFANEIVRDQRILDYVEQVLGPDILVWGATFFIKEPNTENYVSWHQDLKYWGLNDEDGQVTAWLALGPVTIENGAMRFVEGSHKGAMLDHRDTFDDTNVLTRGQEAAIDINEDEVTHVTLNPGQISLHHGKLLHASSPNRSDERRIGLAINYIAPHVKQVVARKDFATLVRGEDRYGNFELVPPPQADLSEEAMAWHHRILEAQNEAVYDGVPDDIPR